MSLNFPSENASESTEMPNDHRSYPGGTGKGVLTRMEVRDGFKDMTIGIEGFWRPNTTGRGALGERVELHVHEGACGQRFE